MKHETGIVISVVIPTYRRPDLLERCLFALNAQDLDPSLFEIRVVDDASSSETLLQVERLSKQFRVPLTYLANPIRSGPAAARNRGWRSAQGKIIAFTDDDTIPDVSWLRQGLAEMSRPGVIAVAGKVVVPLPENPTDYELDAAGLATAEFVTANCFCTKEALEKVGGFDERFTQAWREDSDLHFSLLGFIHRSEGTLKMVRNSKAIVVHPIRPGKWGVSLSQQKKSMFNALLYNKHPRLFREKIQAQPPWRNYLAAVCVVVSVIAAVLQNSPIFCVATVGWLLISIHFCLHRLQSSSKRLSHVFEMFFTSSLIPLLSVYWRIRGAFKFKVLFL
jgi:GT2 family glycosyltransferase